MKPVVEMCDKLSKLRSIMLHLRYLHWMQRSEELKYCSQINSKNPIEQVL